MMLLELAFLAAVAVGLALADIDAATIVGVMAGAWILVALAEWIGAQAARRRAQAAYAPLPFPGSPASADPSWFAPPLERTTFGDTGELTDTGGLEDAEPVHETPPKLPPSSVVD